MTAPAKCPACKLAEIPASALLCAACRAGVSPKVLMRLRQAAQAAKRRERGALDRYRLFSAVAIRQARRAHLGKRQLALFPAHIGVALRRARGEDVS